VNEKPSIPEDLLDLFDAFCDETIEAEHFAELERRLLADDSARQQFVQYFQMHTEMHFAARARRALRQVFPDALEPSGSQPRETIDCKLAFNPRRPLFFTLTVAAALLLCLAGPIALALRQTERFNQAQVSEDKAVAWLANAQDCQWSEEGSDHGPGPDMRPGKVLRLERGLAEIDFERGARVILQGPAALELVSNNRAKLHFGSVAVRVPPAARGFIMESARGEIVDLGTEFGLSVDKSGNSEVHVFEGEIEAAPVGVEGKKHFVKLLENQSARINGHEVVLDPAGSGAQKSGRFVRTIVPKPVLVPSVLSLDFTSPVAGTLEDASGNGTGLTHRLPGTGRDLEKQDTNLRLDPKTGRLALTTTRNDINHQTTLSIGEYLGVRLADLGFTGKEDFAVSATLLNIPGLEVVGQFGLYAGPASDKNIRGGLISQDEPDRYGQFLVNNQQGIDQDFAAVGLLKTGDDLRLTLRRVSGDFSLIVENQTTKSSNTLAIAQPRFLDSEKDFYVGIFGANTQSNVRKTLTIKNMKVTVWKPAGAGNTSKTRSND
jgi:hypothetical protein